METYRAHVLCCGGTGCTSSGSAQLIQRFEEKLKEAGLEKEVKVVRTGCFGLCEAGPVVIVYPEGTFYSRVKVDDVDEIVTEHLLKGRKVEHLVYTDHATHEQNANKSLQDINFYKHQHRVALRNCGVIDPENIDEYLAFDGYKALEKALLTMTREEVIDEILKSGLRGRGGGGFPTGLKWKFTYNSQADQKYVACNADEGDPGAFMDRSVLEGDPHAVIEAMAIAGYAIGASEGYVYVRAEYPIAVKRLEIAIEQAREYGLLGKGIFGTNFDFDIHIRLGAGAFVCDQQALLDYGFSEFPAQTIVTAGETVGSICVVGSKTQRVSLVTGTDFSYPVAEGETVETVLHASEFSYAPVLPGQAGQLEILVDGARVSQVPVYYAQTAEETAPARGFWKRIFGG